RELSAAAEEGEGIRYVCWTGGEPLLQAESIAAAVRRLPEGFVHSFETDGEVDLHTFDRLARAERARGGGGLVMAVMCPGCGTQGGAKKRHRIRACAFAVRCEEIDHTADVAIRAYGRSLDELFANAAEGMSSLIADLSTVKPIGEVEVRLNADDIPTLFLRWLSELLYVHETQRFLFSSFDVHVAGTALVGHARGETIDKSRHELKLAIKAVTRHGLTVDPAKGFAEVIFDI